MQVPQPATPVIMPMRQRAQVMTACLRERLDQLLPRAMRHAGIDMWLVICREDNHDPLFSTFVPPDTWAPILQMLVFFDRGSDTPERINVSMTDTKDLYDRPWSGRSEQEQWDLLARIVADRDPRRIGINVAAVQWAADGLTSHLHERLLAALPPAYSERLVSAETAATLWLEVLTPREQGLFEHVVGVGRQIIADCYRKLVKPGVTTEEDLRWGYWQRCVDLGLELSFLPFFTVRQAPENRGNVGRPVVAGPGDCIVCDVGIRYLGLCSDHQEWAYIPRAGQNGPPAGLQRLMAEANRLQDIFMGEFQQGMTGNELLARILARARAEEIPSPRVYSHSLGHFLHEPGPLIGLPWEQERCPGRGDIPLEYDSAFTVELSIEAPLPEWGDEPFRMNVEQDVLFTREGCHLVSGRQTRFHVVSGG